MTPAETAIPASAESGQWYDVTAIDPAFGVGKRIERIRAASREAAEKTARERHGKNVLVSLSGGRPRRRRAEPVDLGHTPRRA